MDGRILAPSESVTMDGLAAGLETSFAFGKGMIMVGARAGISVSVEALDALVDGMSVLSPDDRKFSSSLCRLDSVVECETWAVRSILESLTAGFVRFMVDEMKF